MENNKKTKTILIILASVIAILAILLIALNLNPKGSNLTFTITNRNEFFVDASDSQKSQLESSLLSYEETNYSLSSSVSDAIIIPHSYFHYVDNNIHNSSFILEIPSLGQALKIYFTWSSSVALADTLVISCPLSSETTYQDFVCFDTITGKFIKISENIESENEIIISGLDYLSKRGINSSKLSTIYSELEKYFKKNSPSSVHAVYIEDSFSRNPQEETYTFQLLVDEKTTYTVDVVDHIGENLSLTITN